MRHSLQSGPPQIGPQGQPPGTPTSSIPSSVHKATLDLLSIWQREDATSDPAKLKAAEEDLTAFMKAVNEVRTASGEPLIYP